MIGLTEEEVRAAPSVVLHGGGLGGDEYHLGSSKRAFCIPFSNFRGSAAIKYASLACIAKRRLSQVIKAL